MFVFVQNGYTALMFAVERGHPRIVKELVLAKANINIRNRVSTLGDAGRCWEGDRVSRHVQ